MAGVFDGAPRRSKILLTLSTFCGKKELRAGS